MSNEQTEYINTEISVDQLSLEIAISRYIRAQSEKRIAQIENNELQKQLDTKTQMCKTFAKRIKELEDEINSFDIIDD